jgi:hypothetical protein
MSHVSISRSYAVLVGLEAYVKTRRKGKRFLKALIHGRDKLLSPEELRERQEEEMDRSQSAAREQRFLELQHDEEENKRDQNKTNTKLLQKLHIRQDTPKNEGDVAASGLKSEADINVPGPGPENGIPPQGTRKD